MLTSYKSILNKAYQGGYAVGAFNCLSLENVMGVIAAAEELHSPVILQLAEVQFPYAPMELMAPLFLKAAHQSSVPVAVHLDHGQSFETCARAIRMGFNSVMFDGACLPFENNVSITKAVVRMAKAADVLEKLGIDYEMTIISAHREPDVFFEYAKTAESKGFKVIIAGAGMAAHLPGMCAAIFPMPVIGIPMHTTSLGGRDSLYSIVQMPTGIPVATVAINGGANAGILAAKILATSDEELLSRLKAYSEEMKEQVVEKDAKLQKVGYKNYKK